MQKKYRKLYDIEAVEVDHEEFPNYLKIISDCAFSSR